MIVKRNQYFRFMHGKDQVNAKNLLDVLDDEVIAEKTGLSIEEVRKLRKI